MNNLEVAIKEKGTKRWLIAIFLIFIIGGIGSVWWFLNRPSQDIKTIVVQRHNLQEFVEVSGVVQSERDVQLKAEVGGQVVQRMVSENVRIPQGKSLLKIDTSQYVLQLRQAKVNKQASQDQAHTELNTALKALNETIAYKKQTLQQLDNAIAKAQSQVDFLTRDLDKNQTLLKEGVVTRQSVDNLEQQLEQARLDLKTAQNNWQKTKVDDGELVSARGRIAQAQVAYSNALKQGQVAVLLAGNTLIKSTITAPFTGSITDWSVQIGDVISPGSILGRIQDLEDIRLVLPINELDLPKIELDDPVDILFDAYPNQTFRGKVSWISESSVADRQNIQAFPVKIIFNNPEHQIKPGMSGDAKILVDEKKNVLSIPIGSVRKKESKFYVDVLQKGQLQETQIKPGLSTLDMLEIQNGLKEGDLVVTETGQQ